MVVRADTRAELIRAGLDLNDELPLERIFSGVTSAAVAARAGVTTGSFFHHFQNATDFAVALVEAHLQEIDADPTAVDFLVDAVRSGDIARSLSLLLAADWHLASTDSGRQARRRSEMHLFAHHRASLPTGGTIGDVLGESNRRQFDVIASRWQEVLDRTAMRLEDPFDPRRLAVSVSALRLGLEIFHAVDPESVDDRLFADTTATLANAVSRIDLRASRVIVADELGQITDASPQARAGARRREETRNRIITATTGMFDDGWNHLSATDIAEASGVSTQTVINLFGHPRMVCAATFVRHLPAFIESIDAAMPDHPEVALREALLHLARSAAADPHPARAFLVERVGIRMERQFDLADDDIRVQVPFGFRLAYVVAALTGIDILDPAVADLGATLIDFVLSHAIPRPGRSEEAVELALRLLPDDLEPSSGPRIGDKTMRPLP